jgi:ribosomal protein L37AE/L43A
MSGAYNRCPYCKSLRKRYMMLGDQKICGDCYEEMAGEAWISQQIEKPIWGDTPITFEE